MDFGDDLNTWVTGEFNKLCWSLLKLIKANQLKTTDAQFPGKGFSNKWHKGTVTCTKMKNNFNHLPTGPILTLLHIHIRIYFFLLENGLELPNIIFFSIIIKWWVLQLLCHAEFAQRFLKCNFFEKIHFHEFYCT